MFQLKELTDVKIAHQVTSGFFCKSSEEMRGATNLKRNFYVNLCLKSVGSEEAIDVILNKRLLHKRVQ